MAQKTVREVLNDAHQGLATYRAVFADLNAAAGIAVILEGAANTIVRLKTVHIDVPAAAQAPLRIVKYSTAATIGTRTTPAGVPLDSGSPAARATFGLYTAAPTAGAAVGDLFNDDILALAPGAGVYYRGDKVHEEFGKGDSSQDVVLRGVLEAVGILLIAGSNPLNGYLEWTEEPDTGAA